MIADGLAAAARCCFNYIKVDGAYLVNAGDTWNTSETWSNYMTNSADGNWGVEKSRAFDGSTETYTYSNTSTAVITIDLSSFNFSGELKVSHGSPGMQCEVTAGGSVVRAFADAGPTKQLNSMGTFTDIEYIKLRMKLYIS